MNGTVADARAENIAWFNLIDDLNLALMSLAQSAMDTVHISSLSPEAIAVRILLRSIGMLQGVILLAERGMVAESRTLIRCLMESGFCIAALTENPVQFVEKIKADSEASRRLQGKFINETQPMAEDHRRKFAQVIDAMDKEAAIMNPKSVAKMGPLYGEYLFYQRISDDSAHVSALSLHRHMMINPNGAGWDYRTTLGDQGEIAATLCQAARASVSVGLGLTQLLKDGSGNSVMFSLAVRLCAMPETVPI